jgi:ATP phosphoribosyltransferase-like protein
MLKLGISKQDRVLNATKEDLNGAGYDLRNFGRTEEFDLRDEDIRFIAVKDIDQVAFMIEDGELDGLLLGADIALEAQARLESTLAVNTQLDLERAKCKISPIVMPETMGKIEFLLSKYPGLSAQFMQQESVAEFLAQNNQTPKIRKFGSGADVQIRRSEKQNQMATDIVETGNTVRQNGGLIIDEAADAQQFGVEPLPSVLKSSIQLFSVGDLDQSTEKTLSDLRQRLEFVLNARKYTMVKYNVPNNQLETVLALTSERKNPTITPAGESMSAVEVMIDTSSVPALMLKLQQAGANSILTYKPELLSAA